MRIKFFPVGTLFAFILFFSVVYANKVVIFLYYFKIIKKTEIEIVLIPQLIKTREIKKL